MNIRVVKPVSTGDLLHEWYVEHGEGSVPFGGSMSVERCMRTERKRPSNSEGKRSVTVKIPGAAR